jgi:DNA-binding NarL/FixJ family response regulator
MPAGQPIRVLLIDDHRTVLWGLSRLMETARPQIEVVGTATTQQEALTAVNKHLPHVVLLDMDLGGESGLDLLPQLVAQAAVIVLTGIRNVAIRERAIVAGARGFLHKSEPAAVILKAIACVHAGEPWLDRGTMGRLLDTLSPKGRQAVRPLSPLTTAERKVVDAIVRQKNAPNKVIAAGLCISEHTLRNHLTSVYSKLGVRGRVDLVLGAMARQLAELPSE